MQRSGAERLDTSGFRAERLETSGFRAERLETSGFGAERLDMSGSEAKRLDNVYLKIQNLYQRVSVKLAPRYCGPFIVLKRIDSSAYYLDLPVGIDVHLVFHVSRLKELLVLTIMWSPLKIWWFMKI
jgi:hypothetical protein